MRIPRCRATVSEEIRNRSLGKPWEGWLHSSDSESCPHSQSQETGANRPHQPLSRDKGECIRSFRILSNVLCRWRQLRPPKSKSKWLILNRRSLPGRKWC